MYIILYYIILKYDYKTYYQNKGCRHINVFSNIPLIYDTCRIMQTPLHADSHPRRIMQTPLHAEFHAPVGLRRAHRNKKKVSPYRTRSLTSESRQWLPVVVEWYHMVPGKLRAFFQWYHEWYHMTWFSTYAGT